MRTLASWKRISKRRARHNSQIPSLVSAFRFSIQFSEINSYTWRTTSIYTRDTHVKTHKLLQVWKQVVTNLFTSCRQVVFALLVSNCCNKFGTGLSLLALSDSLQGCSKTTDTVIDKQEYVTRLTTQGVVTILLYHDCIRLVGTTS